MTKLKKNEKRERIYAAIAAFWLTNGFAPTVREIMDLTGITSTSVVSFHIDKLALEGRISYVPKKSRTIRVLEADHG